MPPVTDADVAAVYEEFCTGDPGHLEIIHVGCPHASFEEMKTYAGLLRDRKVDGSVELWVTTNRYVREMARDSGVLAAIEQAGARVITDTCPISCHFARTCSPDPVLRIEPPKLRSIVVDSAKQARYIRDMVQ